MNLHWYLSRLQRMSSAEIIWRAKQSIRARLDARRSTPSQLSRDAANLLDVLPYPEWTLLIEYFSKDFFWNFEELPWQGAPELDHLTTRHWTKLNYRDVAAYGDPKETWELNRFQFVSRWIRDEIDRQQAPASFSMLVTQWIAKNPYGYGINWTSSLELALRLISWESTLQVLGLDAFDQRVIDILHRSVREHARHLRRYPSLYSSANNHRIGELVGELAAAAMFLDDSELRAGATRAWSDVQHEAKLQVSNDGVSREQATYYHAYVLLYLNRAAKYAQRLKFEIPQWFAILTEKMQNFLNATTDDNGSWFEIGDRDDGDLKALLAWDIPHPLIPFFIETHDPKNVTGTVEDYNRLFDRDPPLTQPCLDGFHPFPQGGYAIWKTPDYHILFRAGNFGYPSIAAHSHCDQLSVLLKYKGQDILTDSGTYSYHDEDRWRRYFKSTAAHNTVRVDGHDQAEYGGPFLWNTAPDARMEMLGEPGAAATIIIKYPTGSIRHNRGLKLAPEEQEFLTVTDQAEDADSSETHTYDLIWNLAPGLSIWPVPANDSGTRFHFTIQQSPLTHENNIDVKITTSAPAHLHVYTGDEILPAGFYSRAFGKKEPITQIRITSTTADTWRATTTFSRAEQP